MSTPIRTRTPSEGSSTDDDFDNRQTANTTQNPGVRRLRPPPEIWELVHPVASAQYNPRRTRIGTNSTNVVVVTVGVVILLGVGLVYWKQHKVQSVNVTAPARAQPAVVKQAVPPPVNTDATTEAQANQATPVESAPVQTSAASVSQDVNTPVKVVKRSAKRDAPAGVVDPPSSAESRKPANTIVNPVATKVSQSVDATATKTKPAASTNELIAPAKGTPTNKPKVIEWP